jgi:hypothetical protein
MFDQGCMEKVYRSFWCSVRAYLKLCALKKIPSMHSHYKEGIRPQAPEFILVQGSASTLVQFPLRIVYENIWVEAVAVYLGQMLCR